MKICNKCNVQKQFSDFSKDKRNSDGLQGICNSCKNSDKQRRRDERAASGAYVVPTEKECNKCKIIKSIDDFFSDKAMRDGKATICKNCKRENIYKWREANKEKYNADQKAYQAAHPEMRYGVEIKRRYGCTLEQYNEMLTKQQGKCAICECLHNPAVKKGRLYVDHDHQTGKIRSLLCNSCNAMLGYAKDKVANLLKAVNYLTDHTE